MKKALSAIVLVVLALALMGQVGVTIGDVTGITRLPAIDSVAADDEIAISDTSGGDLNRATITQLSTTIVSEGLGFTDLDTDYGNETITSDFDFGGGTLQVPNSATLPGTCEVGDTYMDTDATSGQRWYLCESADSWVSQSSGFTDLDTDYGNETITSDFDFGGGTVQVPNSTSLPGTCEVGDSYMDTDATSGRRWYLCESANSWVAQGTVAPTALDFSAGEFVLDGAGASFGGASGDFVMPDIDLIDAQDGYAVVSFRKPADWDTGYFDMKFYVSSAVTVVDGSVRMIGVVSGYSEGDEVDTPTWFNSVSTSNDMPTTADEILVITNSNGSPRDLQNVDFMTLKIHRDGDGGSQDDFTDTIRLHYVELEFRSSL
jgi:hypothetical protein